MWRPAHRDDYPSWAPGLCQDLFALPELGPVTPSPLILAGLSAWAVSRRVGVVRFGSFEDSPLGLFLLACDALGVDAE